MATKNFLVNLDLNQNQLINAVIQNESSAPSSPLAGQIYFDTVDNDIFYYDGTQWVSITSQTFDIVGVSPIEVNFSGGTYSISILEASGTQSGSMSSADYLKLESATSSDTTNTLVQRDGGGRFEASDPVNPLEVVNLGYLENELSNLDFIDIDGVAPIQVSQTGGTYSISIDDVTSTDNGAMLASDKAKLDASTSSATPDTLVERDSNGDFSANTITAGTVTGLSLPVNDSDAANKEYVDSVAAGLDPKESVRVTTIANVGGSYSVANNGTFTNVDFTDTAIFDLGSWTIVSGDRILVKNQSDAAENGIYEVVTAGATGEMTRAEDADGEPDHEVSLGNFTFVEFGTIKGDTGWVLSSSTATNPDEINVGVDTQVWVQFSSQGVIIAGDGLTKTGNTLDVGAGTGLEVSATQVSISDTAVTAGSYGSATQVGTFTVNAQGQLTAASDVSIQIPTSQITDFGVGVEGVIFTSANFDDSDSIDFTVSVGSSVTADVIASTGLGIDSLGVFVSIDNSTIIVDGNGDLTVDIGALGAIDGVIAGDGLLGGGTAGVITLDVNATNGLSTVGSELRLGGTLTQATTIDANGNDFIIEGNDTTSVIRIGNAGTGPRNIIIDESVGTLEVNMGTNTTTFKGFRTDFASSILVGNGASFGSTEDAGEIRWNGSNFQGYDGSVWLNLDEVGIGSLVGGDAISITTGTVSVLYDNSTIGLNGSNELEVLYDGVTIGLTGSGLEVLLDNSGPLFFNSSGINVQVDDDTIQIVNNELQVNTTNIVRKHVQTVPVGSTVSTPLINHDFDSEEVIVAVYDDTSGEELILEVEIVDSDNVSVDANGLSRNVRVVVHG